jgi:hypothetical protein
MNPEQLMIETLDRVCNSGTKGFADLCVKPVAFAQIVTDVLREIFYWANKDFSKNSKQYFV